uniref:Uncharacterized protein n=1 Tax=Anguilla anguilla TaxID=7936 RepID=A0A0E9VBN5_ANGAN
MAVLEEKRLHVKDFVSVLNHPQNCLAVGLRVGYKGRRD